MTDIQEATSAGVNNIDGRQLLEDLRLDLHPELGDLAPDLSIPDPLPEPFIGMMTPELATILLNATPKQRRVRKSQVEYLVGVRERKNEWVITNDAVVIYIDENGEISLQNGQHRCLMSIETGMSFPVLMVVNLPADAYEAFDQGYARSYTSVLEQQGVPAEEATSLAAALLWAQRIRENHEQSLPAAKKPTAKVMDALLEEHPTLPLSIDPARGVAAKIGLTASAVGWLAAYHYAMRTVDPINADVFYDTLTTGANITPGLPIYELRELMIRNTAASRRLKASQLEQIAWLVNAWNAFAKGNEPVTRNQLIWRKKKGRVSRSLAFPKIEGLSWVVAADDDEDIDDE